MTQVESEIGAVVGTLQTDTFCEACGYNLHTQAVWKDERLGLLVCRCPECGRYCPAGHGSSAARTWLNRLATALLVWWVFFLLLLFGLLTLFQGMIAYGYVADSVRWTNVPLPNGKMMISRYEARDYAAEPADSQQRHQTESLTLGVIAIILAGFGGCVFSVFFWHARGAGRLLAFLPPLIGCSVATLIWLSDPLTEFVRVFGVVRIGTFFLLESASVAAGLVFGRPIARGVLTLIVPPKPRQHLAFLWTTDGKALPVH